MNVNVTLDSRLPRILMIGELLQPYETCGPRGKSTLEFKLSTSMLGGRCRVDYLTLSSYRMHKNAGHVQ